MKGLIFQLEKLDVMDYDKEGIEILGSKSIDETYFDEKVECWEGYEGDEKEVFHNLVKELPEGCFEVDYEVLSIKLIEKPQAYLKSFVEKIKDYANIITTKNVRVYGYSLERVLQSNGKRSKIYSYHDDCFYSLHEWLIDMANEGVVGTTYYLGGIIEYKY